MRPFLSLSVLLLALPAFAGDIENFEPCSKSNDCKSKLCSERICKPSTSYNGLGKDGTYCENNGNCKSHNCVKRRCEPKQEEAKTKPSGGSRTERSESRPTTTKRSKVVLDACGKDLRATIYADDTDGAFAEENDQDSADLCARYSPDTIAKAKALFAANYGIGFKETCREIEGKSDAEIACGKKAFDALPQDRESRDVPFKIPVSCSGTQTRADVDRCVKDLASIKVTSPVATRMCATYSADTLAKAKRIVSNGYKHDFATLCRNVDWQTDEELACAQKHLTDLFPDDPDGYEFRVPAECDAPLTKK